jgi:hypothetical protein
VRRAGGAGSGARAAWRRGGASHRHLELPEEIPIQVGELLDAGGAGEGPEAGEVDAVGANGVRAAAAVEGLLIEVLLDGLGEGQTGGGGVTHPPCSYCG